MTATDPQGPHTEIKRELGPQPIAEILDGLGLDNHALVVASAEPLTHKAIGKARKGRRLSPRLQQRIARALNRAIATRDACADPGPEAAPYHPRDLFNY